MNPLTYVHDQPGAIVALIWQRAHARWTRACSTQGQVVALYNYMSQILVELIKLANLIITITKAAGLCRAASRACWTLSPHGAGKPRPRQGAAATASRATSATCGLTYPGAGADSADGSDFPRASAGRPSASSAARAPARRSLVNLIPRFYDATGGQRAGGRRGRARTGAAGRSAAARSAWCRRRPCCSRAPSATTCSWGDADADGRGAAGGAGRRPGRRDRGAARGRPGRAQWSRAAATSPAASASA